MIGKIYKISCKSDPNLVYVGSTTKSLRKRLIEHKYNCRKMRFNMKLYQQINNNDWSDWEIELIEEVEFEDKNDLRMREGEYIKSIGTLNHRIEGRDMKQYYEDNKESIQEYQKQYYEDNKEKIKERDKEYYENNKESIQEYQKQYYEDNKESIQEYKKQYREDNRAQINKYYRDVRKANNHYRNTLLTKCFNAFKNHRADYIDG